MVSPISAMFSKEFFPDLALGRLEAGPRAAASASPEEGRAAHADLDRCPGPDVYGG